MQWGTTSHLIGKPVEVGCGVGVGEEEEEEGITVVEDQYTAMAEGLIMNIQAATWNMKIVLKALMP